jgi:hypothetical protein
MKRRVLALTATISLLATAAVSNAATTNQTTVTTAIMSAISANTIPATMSPTLASVATPTLAYNTQGSSMAYKCSPGYNAKYITKPVPCWFGAASGPTWVLWGDSNAGSWIPAIAKVAQTSNARLAVFVYPGCASQFVQAAEYGTAVSAANCNSFHRALPAAVKTLAPKVVISATIGMGFTGKQSDIPTFATAWKSTFDSVTSNNATIRRVLLGTTPNRGGKNIAACLATSADKKLLPCSPHFYANSWYATNYWSYIQRDITSASTAKATLIPVASLFCDMTSASPNYCPAVVNQKMVYIDQDHVSIAYMNYIAPALTEMFRSAEF